jgi:hypothetical protein
MVGLSESGEAIAEKGFTAEMLAMGAARLAAAHHMPMQTTVPARLAGSVPACRAVVAVRLHEPARERAMLRALRVGAFSGELLDEATTHRHAAQGAGVDPDELERWLTEPDTEAALREDMRAARAPVPEPLATAEIAAVCGVDLDEARMQLTQIAAEQPIGSEGLWSLSPVPAA